MFLNEQELKALTGYDRPSYQKEWLSEHGVLFYENRNGIVTSWHFVNHPNQETLSSMKRSEPNFEALSNG